MSTRPLSENAKAQAVDAVRRYGSVTRAAKALGINRLTLTSRLHAAGYQHSEPRAPLVSVEGSPVEMQATIDDLREQLAAVTVVKRWAAAKPKKRATPNPRGAKHLYIPDTQIKVGVPIDHLEAAGRYAVDKRPDVIVIAGDWWDFPSLSSYDKGKLGFEGRRYRLDVESGKAGMEKFLAPIRAAKGYNPRIVMTLGNHENRVNRAIEENAILDGTIGLQDLQLDAFGIEHYEFLKPVVIDGVAYCHYFPRAASGKVMQNRSGAPNALAQLRREGRSCVAGHTQGFDIACLPFSGRLQWGIIAGSFYQHPEHYLTPQGQDHWHGVVMLHEVKDGSLNPMVVSLDYLLHKYKMNNESRSGCNMVDPYIETSIGRKFFALAENPGFVIAEIAHALSNLCRYGGHCSQFYSVAEHSVLVSEIMEKWHLGDPYEGLLHDASEAYLVDIPGPWKCRLPDYQALEKQVEGSLQRFFQLPAKTPECKKADWIALMVEGRALLVSKGDTMIAGGIPAEYGALADAWIAIEGRSIFGLSPAGARTSFVHRYDKLMRKRK